MKVIDLHEDIILSFAKNPEAFFTVEGKTMIPEYNAGTYSDYADTFDLVFGAIWAYACEGDMQDIHNRSISFTPQYINDLLNAYLSR